MKFECENAKINSPLVNIDNIESDEAKVAIVAEIYRIIMRLKLNNGTVDKTV